MQIRLSATRHRYVSFASAKLYSIFEIYKFLRQNFKKFTFSRLLRKQIKRQGTDYMHNYSPVAHSTHMMVILTQILRTVSQTRIQPGRSCRRPSCPRIQRRNYSVWHIRKLPVSRDIPYHTTSCHGNTVACEIRKFGIINLLIKTAWLCKFTHKLVICPPLLLKELIMVFFIIAGVLSAAKAIENAEAGR